MKKSTSQKNRNLDKQLLEAGLSCRKRLHLDCTAPVTVELSETRKAMSAVGRQLVEIAQSVFPKGVKVSGKTTQEAAAETKKLLDAEEPVLFGATFIADGIEAECDILVRHKDGAVDLYEVKSGTKVKQRYLMDLALQAHVVAADGYQLRAAFLLNLNPQYQHKEGDDFPPMQVLRSTDVTEKVGKQLSHLRARLEDLRSACYDEKTLEAPMGTWCVRPVPCPYHDKCSAGGPTVPAWLLPELSRDQETKLRDDGIHDLAAIDTDRRGLSFVQRRTIECVRSNEPITEDFVKDELRQCSYPLHFVAIGSVIEALPQFDGQRPWRHIPHAWAACTLYEDGRVEAASFAHEDRSDPRFEFASTLGKHVGNGGTLLCWDADAIDDLRSLLEDLPSAKIAVRAVIGRALVDLMQLFTAGVFHPALRDWKDFPAVVRALLDDQSGKKIPVHTEDDLRATLAKALAPRVRVTTRKKLAGEIARSLEWRSEKLVELFRKYAEVEAKAPATKAPPKKSATKPLPDPE